MLKKLLTSALFAGFAGGLIFALLQISLLSPIIIEAELYESGAKHHFEGVADRPMADHADSHGSMAAANDAAHEAGEAPVTEPEESWAARSTRTALSSILTALGFAFLLAAAFGIAERSGIQITARSGVLWGLAGFAGIPLATSLGLPPELPGSVSAALEARQFWWVATAAISVLGIAALAFGKNWAHWGAGLALLALPHIIGAPHTEAFGGVVPPELQGEFVATSLAVSAISWAVFGLLAGYMWARQSDQM